MSISKDVIKQCLISKQREVDEAVLVERPIDFEENGNYVIGWCETCGQVVSAVSARAATAGSRKGMGVITEIPLWLIINT